MLTKSQAKRLAMIAQTGFARAIYRYTHRSTATWCGGCAAGQFCDDKKFLCMQSDCPTVPRAHLLRREGLGALRERTRRKVQLRAVPRVRLERVAQPLRLRRHVDQPAVSDPKHLYPLQCPACVPQCTGKACGPDGCGGTCGTCGSGKIATPRPVPAA